MIPKYKNSNNVLFHLASIYFSGETGLYSPVGCLLFLFTATVGTVIQFAEDLFMFWNMCATHVLLEWLVIFILSYSQTLLGPGFWIRVYKHKLRKTENLNEWKKKDKVFTFKGISKAEVSSFIHGTWFILGQTQAKLHISRGGEPRGPGFVVVSRIAQ